MPVAAYSAANSPSEHSARHSRFRQAEIRSSAGTRPAGAFDDLFQPISRIEGSSGRMARHSFENGKMLSTRNFFATMIAMARNPSAPGSPDSFREDNEWPEPCSSRRNSRPRRLFEFCCREHNMGFGKFLP